METIIIEIPGFEPIEIASINGEKIDNINIDPIFDEAGNIIDFDISFDVVDINGHEILDTVRKRNYLEKIERELKSKMSKKDLKLMRKLRDN